MRRAAHAAESKAVVRIEVAVSPRPCLGCAVELAGGLLHKQGPRRSHIRGDPLPHSHSTLRW
jgi:hypothetical protein